MSLLLLHRQAPDPQPVKTRNKTGVTTIVKQAPKGQYGLAWWQRWLADQW